MATGKLLDLAPQELVDCIPNPNSCGGTGGCSGSTEEYGFACAIHSCFSRVLRCSHTPPQCDSVLRSLTDRRVVLHRGDDLRHGQLLVVQLHREDRHRMPPRQGWSRCRDPNAFFHRAVVEKLWEYIHGSREDFVDNDTHWGHACRSLAFRIL